MLIKVMKSVNFKEVHVAKDLIHLTDTYLVKHVTDRCFNALILLYINSTKLNYFKTQHI